jgi:hypothetical protein
VCPTDADIARLHDGLRGAARSRVRMTVLMGVAIAIGLPWTSLAVDILMLLMIAASALASWAIRRHSMGVHAGLVFFAVFQVNLSAIVAMTGGVRSPHLVLLSVPVCVLALRYRSAVVVVATASAGAVAAAACLLAALLHVGNPYPPTYDAVTATGLAAALASLALSMQSAEMESRITASRDALTGLLNRNGLEQFLARPSPGAA